MAFKREKKKEKNIPKLSIIITASAIALIFVVFVCLGFFMPNNKIASGIYVAGVDVGGMTLALAEEKIENVIENEVLKEEITIKSQGESTSISTEEISLVFDAKESTKKAYEIGKSKNIFKNSVDFLKTLFSSIDVGYEVSFNEDVLSEKIYEFGMEVNGEAKDYEVEYGEDFVTVYPMNPGQSKETDIARGEILKSLSKGECYGIEITLQTADREEINTQALYDIIYALPEEAEYVYENNEFSVKEHVVGVEVEKEALSDAVVALNQNTPAKISAKITFPEKTTELLTQNLFNHTLATYSTSYATSTANRAKNVEIAAKRINEKVLMPGDVFSYNETIGDTTIANGFKVASVYQNGKQTEGVGGGICQVSSTLYSAVLYADLKVVERKNHSLIVTYVPKGQDATVSYGAIDFKFENDTEYPIKISAKTEGRILTVSLIGTKPEVEKIVKLTHTTISSTAPTTEEKLDETLAPGEKKVVSAGKPGYVVDTVKTVYENGVQVRSEKITRSAYKMLPTEMAVGPEESTETDVTVSPLPTEDISGELTPPSDEPTTTPEEFESVQVPEESKEPIIRPTPAPMEEE